MTYRKSAVWGLVLAIVILLWILVVCLTGCEVMSRAETRRDAVYSCSKNCGLQGLGWSFTDSSSGYVCTCIAASPAPAEKPN